MTQLGIEGIDDARLVGHAPGASVYAATSHAAGQPAPVEVAIKVLRRLVASEQQHDIFAKQIAALQQLRELDGVVPIIDGGLTVHGEPYLVLPLLNESAQQRLDDHGPFEVDAAVAIARRAALAVASLHERGLLHLSLKPSNLLFDHDGTVLVGDVGISLLGSGDDAAGPWVDGSPVWAAPESFASDRPTTRTDIYGLGACLLSLISGSPPFPTAGATNPLQLIDRIRSDEPPALAHLDAPEPVIATIRQSMFKDPAARPASAAEFASLLDDSGSPDERTTKPAPARAPAERRPAPDDAMVALLDRTARAAEQNHRDDLVRDIARCRTKLVELGSPVVVVGEHNKGKSTLINALLLSQVCNVDPVQPTSVSTVVSHGATASASLTRTGITRNANVEPATVADAIARQTERAMSSDDVVSQISLSLPAELLEGGLRLVDTPPTGTIDSADTQAVRMLADSASAVLVVVDASRELTATDIALVSALHCDATPVTCVMTKTDFYPRWREVVRRSREHLASECPGVELLPVSSTLRIEGAVRSDQSLLDESGFAPLLDLVGKASTADSFGIRRSHAHNVAHDAITSMLVAFEVERDALTDESRQRELTDLATEAHDRVEMLRSASSRWGTVLSDGISDLSSTVDLQIRTRLRAAITDIEATIDDTDPGETGDELIPAIEARFMTEVAEIQELIETEATGLAERVAQVFDDEADIAALAIPDGEQVFGHVTQRDVEITPAAGRGASLFTGLRGSYSGIAIFGMAGGLLAPVLGAVLLGPLSLVAGAVFGRKVAVDERKRQLTTRRNEARGAVRRYGDDATLHISKHCRDALQIVQRALRDENLARAALLAETAAASRDAAQKALRLDQAEVDERRTELDTQIGDLRELERALNAAIASATS